MIDNQHPVAKKRTQKGFSKYFADCIDEKAPAKFKKGSYQCSCGLTFKYKHILARHLNSFNRKDGMGSHIEVTKESRKEKKEPNLTCEVCGNQYKNACSLYKHV